MRMNFHVHWLMEQKQSSRLYTIITFFFAPKDPSDLAKRLLLQEKALHLFHCCFCLYEL